MTEEQVLKILQQNNLKFIEYVRKPDQGLVRSYVIKCQSIDHEFVRDSVGKLKESKIFALKIFDSDDKKARKRFLAEILYIKEIKARLPVKYKSWLPRIRKTNTKGANPFYLYDFIEAENLSRFIEHFGIRHGQFKMDNFKEFIEFIGKVSHLDVENVESLEISKWKLRNAQKEVKFYLENSQKFIPFNIYDQVKDFLENVPPETFDYYCLSHRDLYPENILIEKQFSKKFTFLDWEYLSYVPLGFNAAFLYLLFWREEFWKAKTFAYFYNQYEELEKGKYLDAFVNSFCFCVVVLSLRFLYQIKTFVNKDLPDFIHAERSFLYDLQNALQENTIKPKNIKFYIELNDIKKVGHQYGISNILKYEIFYASKGNTVARVDTADKNYIFRFYSDSRPQSLIYRELRIFNKLRVSGINTYEVYKTRNKKLLLQYNLYGKERRIAVLSYLQGKKINKQWADEESARNLGRILRKIHDNDVVHGDFSKENVLFNKNKVSGVIDFEWGRITRSKEHKLHDMSKAIALWLTDIRAKKLTDEVFTRNFLHGYYDNNYPDQRMLSKIIDIVISKVVTEKEIYLTTMDIGDTQVRSSRFEKAIDSLNKVRAA